MHKGRIIAKGTIEEIFIQPDLLQSVRLDVLVLPKRISTHRSHGVEISIAVTYADAGKAFPQTIASSLMMIERSAKTALPLPCQNSDQGDEVRPSSNS